MVDTHRLSSATLEAMAEGDSDLAVVEQLRGAYRSRQLISLLAVFKQTEYADVGPLATVGDAWGLLAAAQQVDSRAADLVITLPRTGVWTAEVQRLLGVDTERPLWTSLGYFHQMAAAAAIRAGCDFSISLPVWRGQVLLPSLGMAHVPADGEWSVAEARRVDGRVVIESLAGVVELPRDLSVDGPGWLAFHTVTFGDRVLWLDDIDPYREFVGPVPPRRLSDDEVALWAKSVEDTWQLLTDHHPAIVAELTAGLTTLVPCSTPDYSASHNDAFGSVVLSRPPDATTFAEILVHEFQHNKFGVLLSLVDLLETGADDETRLYAPWRDDPRPPTGMLHGAYSFLAVAAFYRDHSAVVTGRRKRIAQFEFEFHRGRTVEGVQSLLAGADLTELGRRFLDTVRRRLEEWTADPLPADIRVVASRANLDHRLIWRMRQLRPAEEGVAALAEAWLNGGVPPVAVESELVPVLGDVSNPRLAQARTWLSAPETAVTENGADLALLDGDTERAVELYRQQVLAEPESPTHWAGLALASDEKALLCQPELVFQLYQQLRVRGVVADPVELARWLG